MSPEVLIYVKNVKNFLDNNAEAHDYFLNGIDETDFFSKVAESSQKNFEKNGDPMLMRNQFEEIKKQLSNPILNKIESKIFVEIKDFGTICLN